MNIGWPRRRNTQLSDRACGRIDRSHFRNGQIPGPLLSLVVVAGYLALAQFVVWFNDPVNLGAGFWPAAGLSLALLVRVHPRRWGWVLAGVAIAELGGSLVRGYPFDAALWWATGNCLGPLVGALLLRAWGNANGSLVPLRQFRRFLGAAVVAGPLVGASVGSIGTVFALGNTEMWQVWPKYFVGDALGVLVVAPLLLCWKEQRVARHLAETITLSVALPAVAIVAFRTWGDAWDAALPYLVIPLLGRAALRHGTRGAALGVFAIALIANWFTAIGDGLFASAGATTGHAIISLQIFLGLTKESAQ